ncbi:hypothetical protein LARV_01738 [Longilinea arvoryzae]|uniref:ECF transporter S component n=1 Tax=Longilinea arvoryzae TaxID=360412 RepID=A0A0S7BJ81_9CHLR|nr:hypothetical protein [Longilinea arvoryzae]GAP13979.1 hypothetical protein LARV_01738 [Longilinea arvoryzae]
MKKKSVLISAHPAVIAVWAALMAAACLLPAFPVFGTGTTFNIANCLTPLAGIFFGPFTGAIAAGVGAFIGQLIAPHTVLFGPLQFTIAILGAMASGFAMQRKWSISFGLITLFAAAWYLLPEGRAAWATPLLYVLGYIFIAIGWWISRKDDPLLSTNKARMSLGILCCSAAGIVVTQAMGNLWALIFFKLPPAIWYTTLAIAPVERGLFAFGAMIIGTPLLVGLVKIGIPVGPIIYQKEEDAEPEDIEQPAD